MNQDLHAARVYLAQVPIFRARGSSFVFTLLEWAGNARRRAMVKPLPPAQSDLFN